MGVESWEHNEHDIPSVACHDTPSSTFRHFDSFNTFSHRTNLVHLIQSKIRYQEHFYFQSSSTFIWLLMQLRASKPMAINKLSKKLCKSQSMAINKWLPTIYPKTSSNKISIDARLMRKVRDTTFNRRALQLFS
jgi:hypothetical protein